MDFTATSKIDSFIKIQRTSWFVKTKQSKNIDKNIAKVLVSKNGTFYLSHALMGMNTNL
jgi:hypothetical protein